MNKLLKHTIKSNIEYRYENNLLPVSLSYNKDNPNQLTLSNDQKINSSCLNCSKKTCLYFDDNVKSDIVDVVFATDVCPTNALFLDEQEQVSIDEENCIGCNLCAIRCKVGAIYPFKNKVKIHRDTLHLVEGVQPENDIVHTNSLIKNINNKIEQLTEELRKNKKFSFVLNNLLKSCFMALGFKVIKPRAGDVNLRMDLIIDANDQIFLIEIDNIGSPDTIRDILDDIALFSDKYNYTLKSLSGVACFLEFPNKRSEFYELITDIEKILKFNIYSLSLGVIYAILFNYKKLNFTLFSINENQTSCRTALEKILEMDCDFEIKSSAIEAAK